MSKQRIDIDNKVRVMFPDGDHIDGIVKGKPKATRDAWVIIGSDNTVYYVQQYETMALFKSKGGNNEN